MTWYHCTFWDVWVSFSQATVRCFFIQCTAITRPSWNAVVVSFCGTEFRKARISYVSRFYHTEMNVLSECENETHSVILKRYKKISCIVWTGMCHSTTVPACGRESSFISFINTFPLERVRYVCMYCRVNSYEIWKYNQRLHIADVYSIESNNWHGKDIPTDWSGMSLILHPNDFCYRGYGQIIIADYHTQSFNPHDSYACFIHKRQVRQCAYNGILWQVRVPIVVAETQQCFSCLLLLM
jgi:uncharacterized protein (DUF779 family)